MNGEAPALGSGVVHFSDPDGIVLELVEEIFRRDEERRAGVAAYWAQRG